MCDLAAKMLPLVLGPLVGEVIIIMMNEMIDMGSRPSQNMVLHRLECYGKSLPLDFRSFLVRSRGVSGEPRIEEEKSIVKKKYRKKEVS